MRAATLGRVDNWAVATPAGLVRNLSIIGVKIAIGPGA